MKTQLNRGLKRRLMYVENKSGEIDGANGRVGWVTFSKTGQTVYYRGRQLQKVRGGGVRGNFLDATTGEEYWVSGVKKRGSNVHWAERISIEIDADALDAYHARRRGRVDDLLRNPLWDDLRGEAAPKTCMASAMAHS